MQLPTDSELQALATNITNFSVLFLIVWRAIAPRLLKWIGKDKHDTGQTRKVFFDVVADLQKEIEELKQEKARLTIENCRVHEDNEAHKIHIARVEHDLEVMTKVAEFLRSKPPAPPAETQPIKGEGDKEAG